MTGNPATSLRAALDTVRAADRAEHAGRVPADGIVAHFAGHYAGIPANSVAREEKVVTYRADGSAMPVLLGAYGSERRVRSWLPGLPARICATTVAGLLAAARPAHRVHGAACQRRVWSEVDVQALPALRATPRDAGRYLTMGVVYARDPSTGATALSTHRMLLLGPDRLAIWMLPSRRLRALHERAVGAGERLPVSVNIGAPPAAVVAAALTTDLLVPPADKLALAGGLARESIALADAVSQDTDVLAESEIVLEGQLDDQVTVESLDGPPDVSMPEFLGYDGDARDELPVLTVTAVTTRPDPSYQAVIGPGREQSVILGLAGAVSVAMSDDPDLGVVHDVHLSPAGGGMLTLFLAVRKRSVRDDERLAPLARRIFDRHPFVKLIVCVDDDVEVRCAEDVWWAVTTRSNLGAAVTFTGYRPLAMDPSQTAAWAGARGLRAGDGERTLIDATVPFELREAARRSFAPSAEGAVR
ncbi:UbiD family decarboxylase domain-containing protein [Actinophytocola sp.]|uniref:UbiD family decarboxylase domain-containing protein n=1 Tax=Actinophytocola sp. TaxID=1872138 RepID=UPI003D6A5180